MLRRSPAITVLALFAMLVSSLCWSCACLAAKPNAGATAGVMTGAMPGMDHHLHDKQRAAIGHHASHAGGRPCSGDCPEHDKLQAAPQQTPPLTAPYVWQIVPVAAPAALDGFASAGGFAPIAAIDPPWPERTPVSLKTRLLI